MSDGNVTGYKEGHKAHQQLVRVSEIPLRVGLQHTNWSLVPDCRMAAFTVHSLVPFASCLKWHSVQEGTTDTES